jgi:hypothetical protein
MKRLLLPVVLMGVMSTASANVLTEVMTKLLKTFGDEVPSIERAAASRAERAGGDPLKATDGRVDVSTGQPSAPNVGESADKSTPSINFGTRPRGGTPQDLKRYEQLRERGRKGDVEAVLQAHRLARASNITDTGEPYYGYWLFWHLARSTANLHREIEKEIEADCRSRTQTRSVDKAFSKACEAQKF